MDDSLTVGDALPPMHVIDTHAHLDEYAFEPDRDEVIQRAIAAGVRSILTIGITADTSQNAVNLAQHPSGLVYAVVGIQPNYVSQMQSGDWERILELSRQPRVVAIGETGLDRYWDYAPLELQADWFRKHLALSQELELPFIVHCREAEQDVVDLLREKSKGQPLNGVMHSFCGSSETATACLDLGLHISFAGMLTFKKNDELRAIAASIPLDRLLVETDAPYLTPIPKRGKRNEPALVVHTLECLAECHNISPSEMAEVTTANAQNLFRLP